MLTHAVGDADWSDHRWCTGRVTTRAGSDVEVRPPSHGGRAITHFLGRTERPATQFPGQVPVTRW